MLLLLLLLCCDSLDGQVASRGVLVNNFYYGFYLLGFFLQWFIVFRHYCVVIYIFGMFFEEWASIYYMLYDFYCCRAPSALGIFVHIFVIVFCFYHSASN